MYPEKAEANMRYLIVLSVLLLGCAATNWAKDGATQAEFDADYRECVNVSTRSIGTTGLALFGGVGAAVGNAGKDERIRDCMRQKGWHARN